MTSKWQKPPIYEALYRLRNIQKRLERLLATQRLKRATTMVKNHVRYAEKTNGK